MGIQTVSQSLSNEGVTLGFKNKIINGNMMVAQRGTTFSITGSPTYGSVDRWAVWQGGGSASGYFNRVSSGLTGFQYAMRYGRNAGNAATTTMLMTQGIESVNCIPLQGKIVTFSFWARAGSTFSPSGGWIALTLRSGTGIDEAPSVGGGLTGVANVVSINAQLTTTWQRFIGTGVVPSNSTQLVPMFTCDPVGTAGANDYYEITGIQLEEGSSATAFENRPYGVEELLCQRYYRKWLSSGQVYFAQGHVWSTTLCQYALTMNPSMRTHPSISTNGTISNLSGQSAVNLSSITLDGAGFNDPGKATKINANMGSSSYTSGYSCALLLNSNGAYIGLDAEL